MPGTSVILEKALPEGIDPYGKTSQWAFQVFLGAIHIAAF